MTVQMTRGAATPRVTLPVRTTEKMEKDIMQASEDSTARVKACCAVVAAELLDTKHKLAGARAVITRFKLGQTVVALKKTKVKMLPIGAGPRCADCGHLMKKVSCDGYCTDLKCEIHICRVATKISAKVAVLKIVKPAKAIRLYSKTRRKFNLDLSDAACYVRYTETIARGIRDLVDIIRGLCGTHDVVSGRDPGNGTPIQKICDWCLVKLTKAEQLGVFDRCKKCQKHIGQNTAVWADVNAQRITYTDAMQRNGGNA